MAKDTERGRGVYLSWYAYRTLLETVERFARQNSTLATKAGELHAGTSPSSRLVEIDASALRDERRYPPPGSQVDRAPSAPWWPGRSPDPKSLRPNPGWTSYALKGKECALVGCSVAGLQRDVLAKVIAGVERQQQRQCNHIPLFLTDSTDFDLFRTRGYVFEYLPGPEKWATCEGAEPWPVYTRRRFELIKRKWNLTNIVQFGPEAFPRAGYQSVTTAGRPRIIYFPDYTEANPYQTLLYRAVMHNFDAAPGDIDEALSSQAEASSAYPTIFHLHWEDKLHMDVPDDDTAGRRCHSFLSKLEKFISDGGIFVWTIHNLYPHERKHADVHRDFCRKLSRLVHRVHVHSRVAVPILEASHRLDRSKVQVIPHGNYCSVYDAGSTPPGRLREQLGIRSGERVFLFFGKVRRYKGVQSLLRAFDELGDSSARLIIAGRQYAPASLDAISNEMIRRITILDRHIPNEDVEPLFSAVDFVVLPYETVLTSGSTLLALSLSRPPIVPDFEALRDVVIDGVNGYVFKYNSSDGLVGALRRALSTDPATMERMRQSALITATRFDWPTVGEQMNLLLRRASASARDRRLNALTGPDDDADRSPWAVIQGLGRRLWLGPSLRRGARTSRGQTTSDEGCVSTKGSAES